MEGKFLLNCFRPPSLLGKDPELLPCPWLDNCELAGQSVDMSADPRTSLSFMASSFSLLNLSFLLLLQCELCGQNTWSKSLSFFNLQFLIAFSCEWMMVLFCTYQDPVLSPVSDSLSFLYPLGPGWRPGPPLSTPQGLAPFSLCPGLHSCHLNFLLAQKPLLPAQFDQKLEALWGLDFSLLTGP